MGSSGDLSSRVYFEGGSVRKTKEQPCNDTLCLKKIAVGTRYVLRGKGGYKNNTELSHEQNQPENITLLR